MFTVLVVSGTVMYLLVGLTFSDMLRGYHDMQGTKGGRRRILHVATTLFWPALFIVCEFNRELAAYLGAMQFINYCSIMDRIGASNDD